MDHPLRCHFDGPSNDKGTSLGRVLPKAVVPTMVLASLVPNLAGMGTRCRVSENVSFEPAEEREDALTELWDEHAEEPDDDGQEDHDENNGREKVPYNQRQPE